jgi:6-phosphogluconolactonase
MAMRPSILLPAVLVVACLHAGCRSSTARDSSDAPANDDARAEDVAGDVTSADATGATGDLGDAPRDAAASPDGPQYALVCAYLGGISAFAINPENGALVPVSGSPFAAGARLYGIAVHPNGAFVYSIDLDRKLIDGYRLQPATGVLTGVDGAHVTLGGGSPITIAIEPAGRFVYVATIGDDAVHGFAIDPLTGSLSPVGQSPLVLSPFVPSGTLTVDPAGRFLYVTGLDTGIRAFSIDASSGALSEIAGSPFGAGVVSRGAMAFHPSGRFMYNAARALYAFSVEPQTGGLTLLPGSPVVQGVGSDPSATTVAIDPRGRYLYVVATFTVGPLEDTVSGYVIDSTTGSLTPGSLIPVPGSPFAAAPSPYSVAVDRDGRFLYVGNDDSNEVSAFAIDQPSGSLVPVVGSPFPTMFPAGGIQPEIVTVRPIH